MDGRGPMMGGHRGPMGGHGMGPRYRTGFGPGMGFRPMRMHRRSMGFFPMGGLFILPALMFGGWITVAVVGSVLALVGTIIGGVFSGLSALASGVFSGSGLVLGIVIGLVLFHAFRNKKRNEPASTVDGEEVETTIEEPMHYEQRNSRGY